MRLRGTASVSAVGMIPDNHSGVKHSSRFGMRVGPISVRTVRRERSRRIRAMRGKVPEYLRPHVESIEAYRRDVSLDLYLRSSGERTVTDRTIHVRYPEVATHDERLIEKSLGLLARLSPAQYEFQMLLGVTPKRGDRLIAGGHRLRVYVPYGRDWYAYSLRRLRENPEMAQYIARDTIAELFTRR